MFYCQRCGASTPKTCTCKAAASFEPVEKFDEDRGKYVEHMLPQGGMSLRDYFAAKALPAVIEAYVACNGHVIGTDHIIGNASVIAFKFADAMLAERSK